MKRSEVLIQKIAKTFIHNWKEYNIHKMNEEVE